MGNIVMGAHGGVGTLYNIMPRVFHRLLVNLGNGEMTKAREEQIRAQKILRVMMKYGKGKLWHLQHLELWYFFFIIPNNCYSDCGREIGMYEIIYLLCQGHTLNDIWYCPFFLTPQVTFWAGTWQQWNQWWRLLELTWAHHDIRWGPWQLTNYWNSTKTCTKLAFRVGIQQLCRHKFTHVLVTFATCQNIMLTW